jgi:tetratricopeptide (TPR) repeat protein
LFELRERIPKEDAFCLINVDNALTNMSLRDGELRLALGSLDRMMELLPDAAREEVRSKFAGTPNADELERVLSAAYKCEILSRQGRALLQVGAVPQVAQIFETATTLWESVKSNIPAELQSLNAVKLIPCQMDVNAGLFFFSKSQFDQALQSFSSAVEILRKLGDLTSKYHVDDWMGSGVAACYEPNVVYSECVNNLSLSCLYTCQMGNAISHLEGLVREDPTAFLNERVAFNLCTLYELGSDSTTSARKKRVLQLIAKRFFLHDVGPESFRVT